MSETKEMVKVQDNSWEQALEKEAWIAPLVDVFETEDDYYLLTPMPGVIKENVKIKLEDNTLVIMGRIDFDQAVNRNYIIKETETGNYYRRFKLSDAIEQSKIEASLENGILTVRLPKHEYAKPRSIEIK